MLSTRWSDEYHAHDCVDRYSDHRHAGLAGNRTLIVVAPVRWDLLHCTSVPCYRGVRVCSRGTTQNGMLARGVRRPLVAAGIACGAV